MWRERYAQWQHDQAGTRYVASSHAYRLMRWLVGQKWVRRITRPLMLAVDSYRRESDVVSLKEKGARELAALRELRYGVPRTRSYAWLVHRVAVGRVYAALRHKIESKPGLRFTG